MTSSEVEMGLGLVHVFLIFALLVWRQVGEAGGLAAPLPFRQVFEDLEDEFAFGEDGHLLHVIHRHSFIAAQGCSRWS